MTGAAVERGTDATRLVVPGPDGRSDAVAVLPAGTPVGTALEALVGTSAGPVVVVHPPDGAVPGGSAPRTGRRPVPAPVAVLAGRRGRFLVIDAGRSGTTLTVVDDGCVRSTVRVPAGGDRLDAVLTAATGCPSDLVRRARETLSTVDRVEVPGFGPLDASTVDALLRPELDDVVSRVPALAAGVDEVVVAGGLARAPLLAEMLDERVEVGVRVLPEPDLAAVRGALELLGSSDGEPPGARAARADPAATAGAGDDDPADVGPRGRRPGPADDGGGPGPTRTSRFRNGRLLPVAAVLGVLLVGTGTALGATGGPPSPPSATIVQYGYSITLPAGWEHTGGDPQRRRILLTRSAAPDGVELVSVERSPLGYDTATEPDRARDELAAAHRAEGGLGELRPDTVAGRAVTRYRQQAGPDAVVDWFVLFDGTDELAVGCRRPLRGDASETGPDCAAVVGSVRTVNRPG